MNMIRIACIGIAGVVLALFLKQSRSPYAELISMAVCLLILFYSFGTLTGLFELLRTLERSVTVPESYIRILLKITGLPMSQIFRHVSVRMPDIKQSPGRSKCLASCLCWRSVHRS